MTSIYVLIHARPDGSVKTKVFEARELMLAYADYDLPSEAFKTQFLDETPVPARDGGWILQREHVLELRAERPTQVVDRDKDDAIKGLRQLGFTKDRAEMAVATASQRVDPRAGLEVLMKEALRAAA